MTHASDQGKRRYQEDRYLVCRVTGGHLLAVFDGHGGSFTSQLCKSKLRNLWTKTSGKPSDRLSLVMCALDKLTAMYGDGSTASVVYIPDSLQSIHVATLGDSPVIWKNRNGCEQAPEHNVRTNDKERIEAEKRGGHFDGIYICRGGLGLQMSRSLGDRYLRGVVIQTPDIVEDHLLRNSWVVIASDGIYTNEGEKQRVIQRLEMGADAEDLVKFALAIPYNRDNVTAIVFRIGEKRGKSRSSRGAEVGTSSRRSS